MSKKKNKEVTKGMLHGDIQEWEVHGTSFNVLKNYKVIEPVGSGAYGTVVMAEDQEASTEEAKLVAIKKLERAFEHPLFAKRTLRELKILRLLSHENVSL